MYSYQFILENIHILDNYSSREKTIPLTCCQCSATYYKTKHDIKDALRHNTTQNFCSVQCIGLHKKKSKHIVECTECHISIEKTTSELKKSKTPFCSKSCAAVYNNKLSAKLKACKECGNRCDVNKNYCSDKCRNKKHDDRVENGIASIRAIKSYLIRKFGYECTECHVTDTYNGKPITLQLDHIDGDSDNNKIENCRLLCPNCHSQTSTYSNKGGQRKPSKRSRYKREWKYGDDSSEQLIL